MKLTRLSVHFKLLSLLPLLLVGACKKKEDKATLPSPVKVNIEVVGEGALSRGRVYSGTVSAASKTMISFSVPGTVKLLALDEGSKVTKGQLLGKVSNADYVNADNIARATLAEAQDAYERMKKLHDANALPDIKWVEIQQKLKQAQNEAEIASRTLGDATLYSPVNGTISRKMADVGQNVMAGEPVYEIISSSDLTLDITVTEEEIGDISVGQPVKVSFEGLGITGIDSKVSRKAYAADPLTRGYTVKIALPQSEKRILDGMLGNAVFITETDTLDHSGIYNLPPQAVLLDADNRNFVWIVKNGKAERRFVEADELVSNGIAVKAGLNRGDSVIVNGMRKVSTGTMVSVIK